MIRKAKIIIGALYDWKLVGEILQLNLIEMRPKATAANLRLLMIKDDTYCIIITTSTSVVRLSASIRQATAVVAAPLTFFQIHRTYQAQAPAL